MRFENFGRSGPRFNRAIDPGVFDKYIFFDLYIYIGHIFYIGINSIWGGFVSYNCFISMWGFYGTYTFSHVTHTCEGDMRHLAEDDAACRNVWSA